MASGTISGGSDVSYIDVRVSWSSTYNALTNSSSVTANFQITHTGTVDSQGTANWKLWVGSTTAQRTSNTTIPYGSGWTTYTTVTANVPHNDSDGTGSVLIKVTNTDGTTNKDPLVGSGWNAFNPAPSATVTLDNAQLYPSISSFSISRSNVNLANNTSTISFSSGPSSAITTSNGTGTGDSASITNTFAISTNGTPGSYSSFTSPQTVSPLNAVWVKSIATADGVSVNSSGVSTENIQVLYGYPSKPGISSITKVGRKVSVEISDSATDGGSTITSYTVQRSASPYTAWETHNNTDDLTPAATYKFRVFATNGVGNSDYTYSAEYFISAYGYRNNGTNFSTAIETAKVYVGVGQPGADAQGWKTIAFLKRWTGDQWIDLQT